MSNETVLNGTTYQIDEIDDIESMILNAKLCEEEFKKYNSEKVDRIVKKVHEAGLEHAEELAEMAVKETGMGVVEHKIIKNKFSAKYVYEYIKNLKTVGIISKDEEGGIIELAEPVGTVISIIPVTNPTSTTIFKTLISLKTRNPVIHSPSSRAKNICNYLAKILYDAAIDAGAPEYCIQCVKEPSRDKITKLMRDKRIGIILATGGESLVNAAYSSGNPAIGVGPGNNPVYIDPHYDLDKAAKYIILSKTFDNGVICASEQSLVLEKIIYEDAISSLVSNGGYLVPKKDVEKLKKVVWDYEKDRMNPEIVGKSAKYIAEKADIEVPDDTKVLLVEEKYVGRKYPFSREILAPLLTVYSVNNYMSALNTCSALIENGGQGHTASIFSEDDDKVLTYAKSLEVSRIIVNSPASLAAIGGVLNKLPPSLTLGCGTKGKNILSENINAQHLINIKRIAKMVHEDNLKEMNL